MKLQSSIDKILSMFEDTSKQLVDSHALQVQLADRLEEHQRYVADIRVKYENLEADYADKTEELQHKLANAEGTNQTS